MRSASMLQGPIEPPEVPVDYDAARRTRDAFTVAFYEAITGQPCDFYARNGWRTAADAPRWDHEQQCALFCAVQRAASLIGASPAQRWEIVAAELRRLADPYADEKSRGIK